MTSRKWRQWIVSSKLKRTALSDDIWYLNSSVGPGVGVFFEMLHGGVPPGHWNPSYQRHMPMQLILWEYDPWALKCFAFASLDQQELFNFTSNVLFCVLQVWQDFIRFVVQLLLSRGANFHSSKHQKLYTRQFRHLRFLKVWMSWPQRTNST